MPPDTNKDKPNNTETPSEQDQQETLETEMDDEEFNEDLEKEIDPEDEELSENEDDFSS